MRPHRGSTLLAALIVIGVLALVTVATLRLADISKGQSVKDARKLAQAACVDAARQYLISRLNIFSIATNITFDQVVSTDHGDRHIYSGHIRNPDGKPGGAIITSQPRVVTSGVGTSSSGSGGGAGGGGGDIVNGGGSLGSSSGSGGIGSGTPFQVVVACSDPVAGDMELEFTLKFGL